MPRNYGMHKCLQHRKRDELKAQDEYAAVLKDVQSSRSSILAYYAIPESTITSFSLPVVRPAREHASNAHLRAESLEREIHEIEERTERLRERTELLSYLLE